MVSTLVLIETSPHNLNQSINKSYLGGKVLKTSSSIMIKWSTVTNTLLITTRI